MNRPKPPKLTAGLLGAGYISEFHIKALQRLPNVVIIGIADIDQSRAEEIAQLHAIPSAFSSLDELLAVQPDVVHVLTPPAAHTRSVVASLQHGCHVMVEKPLADSVEGCQRIAEALEESGKTLCVDHSLLRDPFIVKAMQIVESGTIGQVVGVDHLRSEHYPHFSGGKVPETYQKGGFPFRDIGVHSIYLLEAFLGEIRDLTLRLGTPETDGNPRFKEWRVLADCERGLGHIYLSWNSNPLQNLLIIHGTRGVIRADLFGMSVTVRKSGRLPNHAERIANTVGEGSRMVGQVMLNVTRVLRKKLRQYHGLQESVAEFYQSIATDGPSPVDVLKGQSAVHWTEKVAEQADKAKLAYEARFDTKGSADVLLTGATGFIGRHLLRRLLEQKNRVRIFVRHMPPVEVLDNPNVEVFLGDLGDSELVDRAMAGIREVYHLGATVAGEAEDFQCATIVGTQNIVDSCLKHDDCKLIYMSSLSIIDAATAARDGKPVKEDFPFEPHPERRGLYTQTKLDGERMVSEAVKTHGLRAVILRPGEVIGPGKLHLSGAVGREAVGRVIVLGGGNSIVPLIWVEDLVDAILAAAGSDHFGGTAFNLVDPEEVTQDELARHYLKVLGQKPRLIHFPLFALFPAASSLQLALGLLGKQSPITPYRLSSALGSRQFDCTAAKTELKWKPRVGIRAGLAAMLDPVVTKTNSTESPNGRETVEPAQVS